MGAVPSAVDAAQLSDSIEPTASRSYQTASLLKRDGRIDEALPYLQSAAAADPNEPLFALELGYAYAATGQDDAARAEFERAAGLSPDNAAAPTELGYLAMRAGENEEASQWFRRAIDIHAAATPQDDASREQQITDLKQLRDTETRLTNQFDLLAYQTYRQGAEGVSGGSAEAGSGIIPSQGGVEIAWTPPVIGFNDDRIFQVYARTLWSNNDQLVLQKNSVVAGAGVRYKPLRELDLYLSAEKVFGIGDEQDNNTLVRAQYGWYQGTDIKPLEEFYNYTVIYHDLGYFIQSPQRLAYFGEARQGITWKARDDLLISPHVVLDGLTQSKDTNDSSYLEGGAGVSFRFHFNETKYESYRSYMELIAQYKYGIINIDSGAVLTAIFRF
ncbi:MAG: tetratricopeptide repeat protein [Rhodospirillales bacterium]|nr:tetratricopeptide repeat protein [Rhodospirillales bacterium]